MTASIPPGGAEITAEEIAEISKRLYGGGRVKNREAERLLNAVESLTARNAELEAAHNDAYYQSVIARLRELTAERDTLKAENANLHDEIVTMAFHVKQFETLQAERTAAWGAAEKAEDERDALKAAVERVEALIDPDSQMAYPIYGERLFAEANIRTALSAGPADQS